MLEIASTTDSAGFEPVVALPPLVTGGAGRLDETAAPRSRTLRCQSTSCIASQASPTTGTEPSASQMSVTTL